MDKKQRWSMEAHKDGKRYSVCVNQCENGFITRITTEGQGLNGDWEYDEKEYISKTNPLANKKALSKDLEKDDQNKITEAVNSLSLLL